VSCCNLQNNDSAGTLLLLLSCLLQLRLQPLVDSYVLLGLILMVLQGLQRLPVNLCQPRQPQHHLQVVPMASMATCTPSRSNHQLAMMVWQTEVEPLANEPRRKQSARNLHRLKLSQQ